MPDDAAMLAELQRERERLLVDVDTLQARLAEAVVLILDGHHLLQVAQQLLAESESQRDALQERLDMQQPSAARLDPTRCTHEWQVRCTRCGVVEIAEDTHG